MIHISEISENRVEHPKEVLHEGDAVTLRVIHIDPANHRIGLSLRKVDSMAYADMDWQTLNESLEEDAEAPITDQSPEATESVTESAHESINPAESALESVETAESAPESVETAESTPESVEPAESAPEPLESESAEPEKE